MTSWQLLLRSLRHHARANLAVMLGVAVGTAVMTGALIVGDSVRASLREITLQRLRGVEQLLHGGRFFREDLARELLAAEAPAAAGETTGGGEIAAPAIVLTGSLEFHDEDDPAGTTHRANRIQCYAVDERFWPLLGAPSVAPPAERDLLLSRRAAEQLGVKAGDTVQVWLTLPAAIPRDSLLGERDETTIPVAAVVRELFDENSPISRFGLQANQQRPLNAFLPLRLVQRALDVAEIRPTRRDPAGQPARVNALFIGSNDPVRARRLAPAASAEPDAANPWDARLHRTLRLADVDLRVVPQSEWGYVSVESRQLIIDPAIESAVDRLALHHRLAASPVYVYLANRIERLDAPGGPAEQAEPSPKGHSAYSAVAGIDLPADGPFSGYEFVGPAPALPLQPGQIVVNDWLAADLQASIGDHVSLRYHEVGSRGELPEKTTEFRIAGIVRLDSGRARDRGLTPEVRGITDARTLQEWDQPFKMDFDAITQRDEDYWDAHRATPKAFLPLKQARAIWPSRYGSLTSIRLAAPDGGTDLPALVRTLEEELPRELSLGMLGLTFRDLRAEGRLQAQGTTDFGGLFVGFSFFLILASAILVSLLFRLGLERRAKAHGLLQAVGLPRRQVDRLFLAEGGVLVVAGTLLGLPLAAAYASLMVYGLRTWWNDAVRTQDLFVEWNLSSLLVGGSLSLAIAFVAILAGLRQFRRLTIRGLLAGQSYDARPAAGAALRARWVFWGAGGMALLLVAGSLFRVIPDSQAFGGLSCRTVAFFLAGMGALVSGVNGLALVLDVPRDRSDAAWIAGGRSGWGLTRLGFRNASRNRARSMLTTGLTAAATFVLVAVAAGQRNPARERPELHSGNGGYTLVAETDRPILFDLNTEQGRAELGLDDEEARRVLQSVKQIVPFRRKPGDDASCLNLFQTQQPTILGVTEDQIRRGGFKFVGIAHQPWERLVDSRFPPIPAFGDMNTLLYSMHKGVGDRIDVAPSGDQLEITAMLDGSVFQGVLLVDEAAFLRMFPDRAGFEYFLIDASPEQASAVAELLETRLAAFGFDAEPVADRLRNFLAVQNTYLSTFQTLGGLGLLLGTIGLAAAMLRNVLERRSELALLKAVGFRPGQIRWLVLAENALLLGWGLAAGSIAAGLAMLPHLASIGADVSPAGLLATLVVIFLAGMLTATAAVREALRTPVVATLRAE